VLNGGAIAEFVIPRAAQGGRPGLAGLHVREGELLVLAAPHEADGTTLLETVHEPPPPPARRGPAFDADETGLILLRGSAERGVTGVSWSPERTVGSNLEVAAASASGLRRTSPRIAVHDVATLLGLETQLGTSARALSPEDTWRLALAVALVRRPGALLLDAITRGLGDERRQELAAHLADVLRETGQTTVYTTNDPGEAIGIADRIAYMEDGEVQQVGTPAQLAARPATLSVAQFLSPGRWDIATGRLQGHRLATPERTYVLPAALDAQPDREVAIAMLGGSPEADPQALAVGRHELTAIGSSAGRSTDAAVVPAHVFDLDTGRAIPFDKPARSLVAYAAAEERPIRVVNLTLHDAEGRRCPTDEAIAPASLLELRLQIGAWDRASVVANARQHQIPELPKSRRGHRLQVVFHSDDVELGWTSAELVLPAHGPSAVLPVALRVPPQPGAGTVRITVYFRRHVLQSLLLDLIWGKPVGDGFSHRALVDYALSDFADVARLPARDLTLVLNSSRDTTHRLIVNGRQEDPFGVRFFEEQMQSAVDTAREALRAVHMDNDGATRYDPSNGKDRDDLIADLGKLANVGAGLFDEAFGSRRAAARISSRLADAVAGNKAPATIQVAYASGSRLLYPWALVYDIPVDVGGTLRACRFLTELDLGHPQQELPVECPYAHEHDLNVICPYGFWGFSHIIELPPSVDEGENLRLCVRDGPPRSKVAFGVSDQLDFGLLTSHLDRLPSQLVLQSCRTSSQLKQALAEPERELVYFYCHGRKEYLERYRRDVSLLEIGIAEKIFTGDIAAWGRVGAGWPADHWSSTAPLVVINGCSTVAMGTADPSDFASAFVGAGASGVVGTEVAMDQPVAGEAAELFLSRLLRPKATVGSALYATRRALLAKGNVMGLAYTAYCSANLELTCPGAAA
jgi:ABC-type branched-subunit amino acid transport system ATPase component